MALAPGTRLGAYEVVALLGAGGMGEVYKARDTRLPRTVAIKLIRADGSHRQDYTNRFHAEARAISALNHPNICFLHDIGQQDGVDYLVMEFIDGESLADALKRGRLAVSQAVRYGLEIAAALTAAHTRGIIHRDLKPGNVMITGSGVKVLDFGLAKRTDAQIAADAATETPVAETGAGRMLGTVAYMSPEQAEGRPLDARSDIFALGVVLYEMLCGQRPFRGESTLSTLASILREPPQATRELRPEIPTSLERIVLRCLEKKPADRYQSATDVGSDLQRIIQPAAAITLRRPTVVVMALLLLVAVGAVGGRWYLRSSHARWAERELLPQAAQLMERGQPLAALKLATEAEQYVPASPELIRLKEDLRPAPMTLETTPAGADIYALDYADPRAADLSHWEHLGRAPLRTNRLSFNAYYRLRILKEGYAPIERTAVILPAVAATLNMELHTADETPDGMVWLPSGPPALATVSVALPPVPTTPAWVDRYEVTNRQFKAFVEAGGYRKREYWRHPFVRDGQEITWEQAMAAFRDMTGRAGPATWEAGGYPDGKADFPVGGVSWYEAAAYAEFAGKSLPTASHWYSAAGVGVTSQITSLSNFGGQGPVRVGERLGLTRIGAYDMAGNVKEWVANGVGGKRYILGGAWNEPSYMFGQADARAPFDRDPTFGFRCVRYAAPVPEALEAPLPMIRMSRTGDRPVDDRTFEVFKSLLSYDKNDLKATVDSASDAPHWRRENISFQAGYGDERVILHLYLPKDAAPPYQPVFYFGGTDMLFARTPDQISTRLMEYIVKSGRAVVLPAYAGTLERGPTPVPLTPARTRDLVILMFKDIARTIDYLETRKDIDAPNLGYCGLSFGTLAGAIALGAEPRFKAAVFVSGGMSPPGPPEIDNWNYIPRIRIPVLMLNGREDSMSSMDGQTSFFNALGTPDRDKRHILYPGGHVDFIDRMEVIKEALDWLDRYLGPVRK